MLAYIVLFSAFFVLQGASDNGCAVAEAQKRISAVIQLDTKKELRCPCNEIFGLHADYNQSECNCFRIPRDEKNCNLSCYQDGVNKYKLYVTNKDVEKLVRTFNRRIPLYKIQTAHCIYACDEMETVTATMFWNRLAEVFQQICTHTKA